MSPSKPTTTTTTSSSDRLLFASCNSQHHEQVLWKNIISRNGSAFVWGGDAVYGDSYVKQASPDILVELYQEQLRHEGYNELLSSGLPVFGILDDHDFGTNNGDQTFPYAMENGIAFACGFLQDTAIMCERAKKGLGVYGVKVMDFTRPKGSQLLTDEEAALDPDVVPQAPTTTTLGEQTVAIFLLDIRSNKTPYTQKWGSEEGDFLGETQWKWFEEALRRSTAAVNFIVEGIQVHADRQGPVETWSRFPSAQNRFYQAVLGSNVRAPIIISGDVHHAQLLRRDCQPSSSSPHPPRMLLEVTTSGMTHSWGTPKHICARPHQTFMCEFWWSQTISSYAMLLGQYLNGWLVWTEVLHSPGSNEGGKLGLQFALERNFAEVELDWTEQAITVRVLGQQIEAPPLLSQSWSLEQLSGPMQQQPNKEEWKCNNYRGNPNQILFEIGGVLPAVAAIAVFFSPLLLLLWFLLRVRRGGKQQSAERKSKQS